MRTINIADIVVDGGALCIGHGSGFCTQPANRSIGNYFYIYR